MNFVVISIQRSGSTLLSEYLISHPDIYMGRELFKLAGSGRNACSNSYRYSKLSIPEFLNAFYAQQGKEYETCGFKLMWDQIEQNPQIADYLIEHKIFIICLERRNLLKTHVSRISARERQLYHTESRDPVAPVSIDIHSIQKELYKLECVLNKMRSFAANLTSHTIYYEDLVEKPKQVLVNLQNQLNIHTIDELSTPLKKINNEDLNIAVANYKDLYSVLIKNQVYSSYLSPLTSPD